MQPWRSRLAGAGKEIWRGGMRVVLSARKGWKRGLTGRWRGLTG